MIKKESSNVVKTCKTCKGSQKDFRYCLSVPRLCVFRSLKNIYAQVIDDTTGTTLAAASSLDADLKENYGGNKEAAKAVGEACCQKGNRRRYYRGCI